MFALIITIISIALVAALALATIYYGGTAFNRNSTEIKAAEIMLQQQQIRAAITLYKADHEGKAPQNLQTLITANYLRQVPAYAFAPPDPSLLPSAKAAETILWVMPAEFTSTFVLAENVSTSICAEVNFKARAFRGVPNQLYTSQLPVQCYYSNDKQSNIVVATDDIATVHNALTGTNTTPTDPAKPFTLPPTELNTTASSIDPADPSKWKVSPSDLAAGNTGGTGTGTGTGTSNFNVSVFCSECSANPTVDLTSQTSFGRTIYVTASNISASQAGKPIIINLSSAFPFTAYCDNSTFSTCDDSNPNAVIFTPNQGSSADITLYVQMTPNRITSGSATSSTGATTVSAQISDPNNTDNTVSFTTTATNLNAVIVPPYTGYTPAGELIIYEGFTPINLSALLSSYFNSPNPFGNLVQVSHNVDDHNFDRNNFLCDNSFTGPYSSCALRPGTYSEGPSTLTFQAYTPTYEYIFTTIPVYITHAPNPYQSNAIANGSYPPASW